MAPAASPSNPYKRQIDAVQRVYDCAKRLKTNHESSDSAYSTVSTEPKPLSTNAPDGTTGASDHESDDESWISESSEEPSDESSIEDSSEAEDVNEREMGEEGAQQGAEEVVNIRANRGKRPDFKLPGDEESDDIRPFLKAFLPKLKAANEELEAQKRAGTLQSSEIIGDEEADGEEQYIEMNLGLGVLEEQDDEADNDAHGTLDEKKKGEEQQQDSEKDVLGKLMGRERPKQPIGIQEVADTQGNT
ncbi:hypothetical protein SLS60_003774 [Paraconiothyrium brasiliense]|uniref:Uncharacterized protein n=1 Tax=Paraconiothyrium brasiliense TaxID=300254 RepID=A0ABR3RR33_9PLEO